MAPPSQQQILDLAERALAAAGPAAQVTAFWELRLETRPTPRRTEAVGVEVVCLDAGVGRVVTEGAGADDLASAAAEARRLAAAPDAEPRAAELPAPAPGRDHDGWDPGVLQATPEQVASELDRTADGLEPVWRAGAARSAVLSTAGVRAFEQRTFAALELTAAGGGRTVLDSVAAIGPGRLDVTAAASRTRQLLDGAVHDPPAGEHAVVLGPVAVAVVLDLVRPHFGSLAVEGTSAVADRLGRRVMAPCVNLSDSPRFPGTLPRSYDAEGLPRQPLPLVQDGVAHRVVRDSASPGGPSTGHATVALRAAPAPEHLVLVGGGAADEDELMRPIERGLYIPALSGDGLRALGAFAIEDGHRGRPLADFPVATDGVAVLAGAQALSMTQRLIPAGRGWARTIGASMCPALRAGGGIVVTG